MRVHTGPPQTERPRLLVLPLSGAHSWGMAGGGRRDQATRRGRQDQATRGGRKVAPCLLCLDLEQGGQFLPRDLNQQAPLAIATVQDAFFSLGLWLKWHRCAPG